MSSQEEQVMKARLTRSRSDRVLGGVCGGLGEYLRLDPIIVRLFFVLLALGNGIGVFLYLLLWIVLPEEQDPEAGLTDRAGQGVNEMGRQVGDFASDIQQVASRPRDSTFRWIGITLMLLGGYYLLRNLDLIWFRWLNWDVLWPILLIAAGLVVLLRRGVSDGD